MDRNISFNSILQKIESDLENKEAYKEDFSLILTAQVAQLESENNHSEVLKCFETALKFYGQDSNILVELGSFFAKFNRDEEAKEIFRQAYENDKKNLRAYQSLQNIKSKIPRWHFKMLNDEARNEAFRKAIKYWIEKENKVEVIDIGTGSSLLSLYAAECSNVKNIFAVESDPLMCHIAERVIGENECTEKIKIINKNSIDIEVGKDIPSKATLIFSEILDSGAFGEGILDTFINAKESLLNADGKFVPHKVVVHVTGYNSKSLCTNNILLNETFNEYIFLDNYRLIAERHEPYDAEYADNIGDFRLVTNTCSPLEVDFNSIKSMNQHFDGIIMKNFQLQSDVNDYLDGFIVWFDLYLNEKDPSNVISTKPQSNSCWNQAIFPLRERVLMQKYEIIKLTISCRDGILKIDHNIDVHLDTVDIQVDPYILRFLNDEEYLENLEYAANEYKENVIKNCLDLSPFPYIGFLMLKESRAEYLWCSRRNEKILKLLATKNCIDYKLIVFVDDDMTECDERFELIILNPFHELGDLNSDICNNFNFFQGLLKSEKSLIIPYKVSLFGELVNSEWLSSSCRVVNENIKKLKIDKYINEYSTELFLDIFEHFNDYEKLTDEFRIANIVLKDDYHEKTVSPLMRNINLPVTAILLFFKIQMTMRTNREFSTQKSCFFRRFAHILPAETYINNAHAKVFFQQNNGIIKIGCE